MKTLNLFVIYDAELSGYSFEFLNILSILSIFTAIFVIITKNPIISVLYLIGLFITIAVYLVLVGISFLGLSYLLVYVGAVSILFLFILMLINVRISELVSDTKNSIPLVFITALSFTIPVTNIIVNSEYLSNITKLLNNLFYIFYQNSTVFSLCSTSWEKTLAGFSHINSIGNIMYTSHNIWLILVSLILLLAMVGTIVITLKYKDNSKLVNNINKPYGYVNLPLQSNIFSGLCTKIFWQKVLILFISGLLLRSAIFTILNVDICIDICDPISISAYSILRLLNIYANILFDEFYLKTPRGTYSLTDFKPSYNPTIHSAMVKPDQLEQGDSNSRPSSPPIKREVASSSPQPLNQSSIPTTQDNTTVKTEDSTLKKEKSSIKRVYSSPVQENIPIKTESTYVDQDDPTVKQEVAQATDVLQTSSGVNQENLAKSRRTRPVFHVLKTEDIISPKKPTAEEIQLKRELKALNDKARDLEWCINSHNSNIGINKDALADKHLSDYKKFEHAKELANQLKSKEALIKELSDLSAEARSLLKSDKYSISSYLPSPEVLKKIEDWNKYNSQENPAKKIKLEDVSNNVKSEDSPKKIKSEPKD